jgi:hypothetical protein
VRSVLFVHRGREFYRPASPPLFPSLPPSLPPCLINGDQISDRVKGGAVDDMDDDATTLNVPKEGETQAWREGGREGGREGESE